MLDIKVGDMLTVISESRHRQDYELTIIRLGRKYAYGCKFPPNGEETLEPLGNGVWYNKYNGYKAYTSEALERRQKIKDLDSIEPI